MKTKTTKAIDWKKVTKGAYFTANIAGTKCSGIVEFEDSKILLCQDSKNGDEANNKHGYRYSWTIGDGSDFAEYDVKDLVVTKTKPIGFKEPKYLYIGEYEVKIKKGHITVGCTPVDNDFIRSIVKKLKD